MLNNTVRVLTYLQQLQTNAVQLLKWLIPVRVRNYGSDGLEVAYFLTARWVSTDETSMTSKKTT